MTGSARGTRKVRVGTVVSDKMKKTVIVTVARVYHHPLYQKVIRAASRCYAHDEKGEARVGDTVRIVECRPLSRLKRWRLIGVLKKGRAVGAPVKMEEEVRELDEEIRGVAGGDRRGESAAPAAGEGDEAVEEKTP
jgi:small subunit ribosomal protein S17